MPQRLLLPAERTLESAQRCAAALPFGLVPALAEVAIAAHGKEAVSVYVAHPQLARSVLLLGRGT
jgi:hypothetical protein